MATLGADFPGASGDYIWAADSPGLSVTGDITLIACLALDDWTPSGGSTPIAKWLATGNQRSWLFQVAASGNLEVTTSALGGTTLLSGNSGAAPAVSDGATLWIAATLDVNDGSGNRVYKFYTSTDPRDTPVGEVVWTQLGATVTTAGTAAIFNSTARAELGAFNQGTAAILAGIYYYAEIRSGLAALDGSNHLVGGSSVGDPNILTDPTDHTVTTFSDGTNTWTVAGNVDLLAVPTVATAAEVLPAISEAAAIEATVAVEAADQLPALTESVLADLGVVITPADLLPSLSEALTVEKAATEITASEQLPALTEALAAVVDVTITIAAAETLPSFGEAADLTVTVAITGADLLPALGEALAVETAIETAVADLLPALTETVAAEAAVRFTTADQLPALGEHIELDVNVAATTATLDELLPAIGEAVSVAVLAQLARIHFEFRDPPALEFQDADTIEFRDPAPIEVTT